MVGARRLSRTASPSIVRRRANWTFDRRSSAAGDSVDSETASPPAAAATVARSNRSTDSKSFSRGQFGAGNRDN